MDTSGVMVLALSKEAHRQLSRQFEQRQTSKRYIAVVDGMVADNEGRIELPIITDWPNRPLQKVDFESGKAALTLYRVLNRDRQNHCSRLELTPVTGRSHQLRIHLAELGHPIRGCSFYAPAAAQQAANRLQLHASELRFTHPDSGESIIGIAPSPF
jgi:tRNA pseudouridine32 synthase/23S rRNA pseudouridine746 synthase